VTPQHTEGKKQVPIQERPTYLESTPMKNAQYGYTPKHGSRLAASLFFGAAIVCLVAVNFKLIFDII
jgi:hypothetical protein